MCAAPGSKVIRLFILFCKLHAEHTSLFSSPCPFPFTEQSAQLLESLHLTDTPTCTTTPSGLLIANDSDHKRYVCILICSRVKWEQILIKRCKLHVQMPPTCPPEREIGQPEFDGDKPRRVHIPDHPNSRHLRSFFYSKHVRTRQRDPKAKTSEAQDRERRSNSPQSTDANRAALFRSDIV